MIALPPPRDFTADALPAELRRALEPTLIRALNEFARPVTSLLRRGLGLRSALNVQVLEKRVSLPAEWTPLTLAAGWDSRMDAGLHAAAVRMPDENGLARLRGVIKRTSGSVTTFSTLPAACRPEKRTPLTTQAGSANGCFNVDPDGSLVLVTGTVTSTLVLDMMSWFAAAPFVAPCWGVGQAEFASTLKSSCLGLIPIAADELDAANQPNGHVHPGLPLPSWKETADASGAKRKLIITNQTGLTPGKTYRVRWLALGE